MAHKTKRKTVVGYTAGVFDLFHIGHLNLLRNARAMCDRLIVGVTTDKLLRRYKKKRPVFPFSERAEIVRSVRFVDAVIPQEMIDKYEAWKKIRFDVLFVGDDWYGNPKWEAMQHALEQHGVSVVYFPYTKGTSSTLINDILVRQREALARKSKSRR